MKNNTQEKCQHDFKPANPFPERNQIIQYIEKMKDINHEAKSYQERRDQLEFVRGYGSALNELSDYIKSLTP